MQSTIIDCLRDVEAEVKARMISSTEHKNELIFFVLNLRYIQLRTLIFQQVWIY